MLSSTTTRYDPDADSTVKSSKKRKFSESSDVGSGRNPITMDETGSRQSNEEGPPHKKHKKKKVKVSICNFPKKSVFLY